MKSMTLYFDGESFTPIHNEQQLKMPINSVLAIFSVLMVLVILMYVGLLKLEQRLERDQ